MTEPPPRFDFTLTSPTTVSRSRLLGLSTVKNTYLPGTYRVWDSGGGLAFSGKIIARYSGALSHETTWGPGGSGMDGSGIALVPDVAARLTALMADPNKALVMFGSWE
jgi:hypothetical protein